MKVVEDDGGSENKKRFDPVHTMIKANCVTQYLLQTTAKCQAVVASHEMDIKELSN